ncbi:cytochrome c oxidase assembly protein [Sinorhizobium mexicanum]|uniref:Cytochrome c oxidase assembly protein n=1 Tax=Sinorhizobium mexicanum TaxID=375549 RepID=A0A859R202_9HYPH|nr:cytochrome c oxidase assembly protein [Sinorhizobium mexicanum]MBP1884313.1 cytochrome c oxidase assembly factor CtaG [Sinorhizobium mexicanum]QLL65001.1 cytochrome c oxidase assembly protein [Sinorhizobium mexicanum]
MPVIVAALVLSLLTRPAAAHEAEPHVSMLVWSFDPWVVAPIAIAGLLYAFGSFRLWLRARNSQGITGRSALIWWAGWLVLAVALVSPVHFLGEHLFALHMIEHELVMAVSAPLLVLSRPVAGLVWGLPRKIRRLIRRGMKEKHVEIAWDWLTRPSVATLMHGAAIWAWHAPLLFDATLGDMVLHRLQHLSFFVTALLFWWSMLWRSDRGVAAFHLFLTMLHTSALGALIALAPRVVYPVQTQTAPEWGLTQLEDQQLAGMLMWMPGGILYGGAGLALLALWIARSSRGGSHASRLHSP